MKIRTKRRALEEIPLASTADIAFLLIVFYLAASSLLEFRGVQIPLPKKDAPPMQVLRKDIFRIKVNAAGGRRVYVDDSDPDCHNPRRQNSQRRSACHCSS